ncbi:unnamed protein product, partial [Staurois parvus]
GSSGWVAGHQIIKLDRIIRLDPGHQAGSGIRLGHQAEQRSGGFSDGRLTGLDTGRMVLVGKNFRFILGLVTGGTASKCRSVNGGSSWRQKRAGGWEQRRD